ncbi:unnamed protein product [Angiostrongylus costaricensis]|uniref:Neur_chan_LBD domain-containing protein n=1 Tax=Angiostrongylus costaricensis TaxID=334426 RepID=A0A0R3PIJ5_ANGCS|nr:unnamed protein product [Angiostrongylus costaricensis]
MDSDIGVVNPKRRIEDFIDPKMEIIFYDRFFNWEVAAGSYLVRNSNWSQAFLQGKLLFSRYVIRTSLYTVLFSKLMNVSQTMNIDYQKASMETTMVRFM